jgi:hypothetical protein
MESTAAPDRRVPIDELEKLPEFALLPEGHQKFLAAYIRGGYDAKAAVFSSYPKVRTQESARVMGVRILQAPGVLMLLSLHFGDEPRDAFCKMVAKAVLRGRISKTKLEAFKLIADVREFRQPWAPRYERVIRDGLAANKPAVKKRVQRAAKTKAAEQAAENPPPVSLMPDFEHL